MSKVRMRYPAQALAELRREDPDTPITLNYIRSLVKSGKVPAIRIGRGYLMNYDMLLDYLESTGLQQPEDEQSDTVQGIRRIRA